MEELTSSIGGEVLAAAAEEEEAAAAEGAAAAAEDEDCCCVLKSSNSFTTSLTSIAEQRSVPGAGDDGVLSVLCRRVSRWKRAESNNRTERWSCILSS